ncbi:MAG: hypothetical protein V4801_30150 [Burkholderia gladioli]
MIPSQESRTFIVQGQVAIAWRELPRNAVKSRDSRIDRRIRSLQRTKHRFIDVPIASSAEPRHGADFIPKSRHDLLLDDGSNDLVQCSIRRPGRIVTRTCRRPVRRPPGLAGIMFGYRRRTSCKPPPLPRCARTVP